MSVFPPPHFQNVIMLYIAELNTGNQGILDIKQEGSQIYSWTVTSSVAVWVMFINSPYIIYQGNYVHIFLPKQGVILLRAVTVSCSSLSLTHFPILIPNLPQP